MSAEAVEPLLLHVEQKAMQARWVDVRLVDPNPRQPRVVFSEEDLEDLCASIREVGILQPITVRPAGERYELVMGERRLRAARMAGLASVPAVVREVPDGEMLREALLENLQRADLNPLEEAAALRDLLDDWGCTQEELGKAVGKSRAAVTHALALLRLPDAVQRRVAAGVLSAGHARALVALGDAGAAERLAERIVAEGLSVRMVEEMVAVGIAAAEPRTLRRGPRRARRDLSEVAGELSEWLETRVQVRASATRGRITVDFSDAEDLERILGILREGAQAGPAGKSTDSSA